jgi:hypothetical protein
MATSGVLGAYWDYVFQGNPPAAGDRQGVLHDRKNDRGTLMSEITEGLTHTIMVAEVAGMPDLYRLNVLVQAAPYQPTDPNQIAGAGWGDPFNGENWLVGSTYDGKNRPGPCVINCVNRTQIYSFHTGGSNVLACDASVHFLAAATDPKVVIALICIDKQLIQGIDAF